MLAARAGLVPGLTADAPGILHPAGPGRGGGRNAPGALARFPFDYRNAFETALTAPDGHRSVRAMAIIILNVEITL